MAERRVRDAKIVEQPIRRYRGDKPALEADAVAALSRELGEGEALARLRSDALATYEAAPLPYRGAHLWKYTDPAVLFPSGALVPDGPARPGETPAPHGDGAAALLQGGAQPRVTLSEAAQAAGVRLLPIAAAGGLLDQLGRLVGADFGLFEALNAAAFTTGLVVHVPRRARLEAPIHVRVDAGAGTTTTRLLVVVEELAEATVFEEHVGGEDDSAVNGVTEIFAGPAATVAHVLVQRWNDGVRGHQTVRSQVERDANVRSTVVSVGGAAYKVDFGATLAGPGARSDIGGVVLADGTQHMDHHTVHDHRAPNTGSNINLKVVVAGAGRSAYTGLIRIAEDAGGSEAYQENRNLLLSGAARAETIPELEILTDEVMCTHGATVAPVDQDHLFYLQSRGLEPRDALRLVLDGFFRPTLDRLPEALRETVAADVAARLGRVTPETAPHGAQEDASGDAAEDAGA